MKFHNQLTRSINSFSPQTPGNVSLYTCGPTVYDRLHVGNWAAYIYWDVLVRTLTASELAVTRVMNITDVGHLVSDDDDGEDKLEKGARRENKTAWDVAAYYTEDFLNGMERLHLIEPTHITKATNYIDEQLQLVRTLKQSGHTYQINDGIYFDTATFPRYADFAGLDIAAQRAGARVEFNQEKRHASDFALWKFTPAGETRDMQWDTPADITNEGNSKPGFPGWHLECSAMAMSLLGDTIDIHTGGIDHIPVHHTNEIAQSEAASGQPFARYWLHNNHLTADGTKISKSLQNGYTLDDLEQHGYTPLDFKLFILQSHYRSESNFSFDNLAAAKTRLMHWRNVAALRHQVHDTLRDETGVIAPYAAGGALREALQDDLNTPEALRIVDAAFDELEKHPLADINRHALLVLIETIDELLGLELISSTPDIGDDTKQRILERQRARDNKDFAASDRLRTELEKSGVTVRDTTHGPIWQYTR